MLHHYHTISKDIQCQHFSILNVNQAITIWFYLHSNASYSTPRNVKKIQDPLVSYFLLYANHFPKGAFHLVCTHLGVVGEVQSPIHFHCVLHAKRGWVGPDSM